MNNKLRLLSRIARPATLTAAVALTLAACGGGDDTATNNDPGQVTFSSKATIDNLTDNVITATYVDLNTQAQAMLTAISAMTDGASEAELAAAQTAWKQARLPWESSEGFLFGPVDSLGIDPAIDSWPLNTPDLEAFITSNPAATQADVENAGDDLRGFHAIEFLLFGDGVADNTKSASELTTGQIAYLEALAQAFSSRTDLLAASWVTDFNSAGPFANLVKTAGASGNTTYVSQAAVFEEFINGVITIIDEVANAKIAEPFGTSTATANTTLVESQYSWNSLTDFHNNVQSVLNVYSGQRGFDPLSATVSTGSPGLYAFVAAHDATLAERVLQEITQAQQAIALIKGDGVNTTTDITGSAQPFRTQIADAGGRALISSALTALSTLLTSLQSEVLPLVRATEFVD